MRCFCVFTLRKQCKTVKHSVHSVLCERALISHIRNDPNLNRIVIYFNACNYIFVFSLFTFFHSQLQIKWMDHMAYFLLFAMLSLFSHSFDDQMYKIESQLNPSVIGFVSQSVWILMSFNKHNTNCRPCKTRALLFVSRHIPTRATKLATRVTIRNAT